MYGTVLHTKAFHLCAESKSYSAHLFLHFEFIR